MDPESNLIIEIKDEAQQFEGDEGSPSPLTPVTHLGLLFIATAGQNGPNLGCDEEEIVLLVLSILKVSTNEVVETKSFVVQPHTSDINENLLSEECKVDFMLCEEQVKNAKLLDEVIEQIDDVISNNVGGEDVFILVVDGQLPLRQCLHPETSAKEINLPKYYNSFFDLRKEFFAAYHYVPESIDEMLKHLNLEIPEESTRDGTRGKLIHMTHIVQHLLTIGHIFEKPELIHMKLEPGLCSQNEEVDGQTVVRARGLPWQSSDADIAKFFRGLNIAKGGVALCLSPQGRRNGEALIRFQSQEHRDMALRRHKHHIGARYIEVYKATGEDFIAVAGGSNNEAQAFLIKGGQVIIRMRGLPYDCTAKQVLDFFDSGDNACQVMDDEEGVLFVRRADGRATGDAFVLFAEESDAGKALSKHRESIGSRYIELFRSTTAEVQQVLNRCLEAAKSAEVSPQLPLATPTGQSASSVAQVPAVTVSIMPQHMITAGTRKDCVRLRGLPYEAQVQHILDFLGDHAKNIVYQGVHMVYNAQLTYRMPNFRLPFPAISNLTISHQIRIHSPVCNSDLVRNRQIQNSWKRESAVGQMGQPSGEAFIQMDSEQSAFLAAQAKHHRYMVYFKKQRYIEVFQCSGEDMNMVLTGGIPLSPQKTHLVSPGMLSPPPEVGGASLLPVGSLPLSPPLQRQGQIGRTLLAPAPYGAYSYVQGPHLPSVPAMTPRNGTHQYAYPQIFYWPYPSPPVSPTTYYGTPVTVATQALIPPECMGALSLGSPLGKSHQNPSNHLHYNGNGLPMGSNGMGPPDLGPRILNGESFRTELSLSDKHRHPPALLPTKNYAELPLFIT